MFRKPPSKLELLQDAAVNALDSLRDAVADLPADQVAKTLAQRTEGARRVAAAAQKNAAHAAAGAGQTAAQNLEAARERAAGVASSAAANTSGAAQHAGEAVAHAAQALSDALSGVMGTAGDVLGGAVHGVGDRWQALRGRAGDAAEHAGESAADFHEHVHDNASRLFRLGGQRAAEAGTHAQETAHDWSGLARDAASAAASLAASKAARAADAARSVSRRSITLPAPIEIEEKESSSSHWLWFLVGILAGGAIMLLLAPASGRRNRAVVSDKLRQAKRGAQSLGGAAAEQVHDLKNRAGGMLHERMASGEIDDADDLTIADRVRTALGEAPATRHMERLNVDVFQGLATLRGPVADAALQAEIETIVRAVKGVTDVKLDLLVEESSEDTPTFVG